MSAGGPVSDSKRPRRPGRYDSGQKRRAQRAGRQAGCVIYISADELEAAGFEAGGPLPLYRVWGTPRGGVMVRLYREPAE